MKNQQIECKRLMPLVAVVLTALILSPTLWAADGSAKPASPAASTENADNRQAFYVRYARGQADTVRQAVANAGGRVTHQLPRVSTDAVLLPDNAAQALSARAGVELIEPVPEHRLAGQTVPYNIDQYQALDIWDADRNGVVDANAPDGSAVKFCIIDTGLYAAHDDFVGVTKSGISQISGEAWSEDGNGHGTHVAGTANAVHNNIGVVGTMPGGAEFFIVKIFDNTGNWVTGQSNLGDAAIACRDAGVNVISMSLGGGSSATEEAIFQDLYDNYGILNIAAAGNDGTDAASYPASYDSVISVAAIDSSEVVADFSQHPPTSYDPNNPPANTEWDVVEFSGGGVNVLSTWPGSPDYADGSVPLYQVTVNGVTYDGTYMDESGLGDVTGPLIDGGLCDSVGSWSGAVVLCERGSIGFADKINNVRDGGGLGAVIYNNTSGDLLGTCGGNCTTPLIPAIGITQADGQDMLSTALGNSANLVSDDGSSCTNCTGSYNAISGTSMATPGVAAAVALAWDACGGPAGLTNKQIRQLLRDSAKDLSGTHPGTGFVYGSGWDQATGWGLVKLKDAQELGNQLYGSTCPIGLQASPATLEVCGATDDTAQSTITLDDAFQGSATMSTSPLPTGAFASFSPNPVIHPTKDTTLTLSGLGNVASGSYAIEAIATDDSDPTNTASAYLTLDLDATAPGQTSLQSPANGTTGVSLQPTLSWNANGTAGDYLVEIATDSGFSSIVDSATVTGTSHDVPAALDSGTTYYWRVTAANHCGSGTSSSTFSFTTASVLMACRTPDLAITDGSAAGVDDVLSVADDQTISDLNIYLRGTHTWVGDLSFTLTHPDGSTQAVAIDRPGVPSSNYGCGNDDFDLWLDDEGLDGPVEDQCGSSPALFGQPVANASLSAFDGLSSAGNWTLNASDSVSADTGSLAEWCLEITYETLGPYTLTYTAGTNGSIIGTTTQTVAHGSDGTPVEALPDAGYSFVQWSDGSTANPRTDINVTADITVEAQFAINSYAVSASVGSGNGSIAPASQSVDHGGTAGGTLSADGGWSLDTLTGDTCSPVDNGDGTWSAANITEACAVTATFMINTYTVTAVVGSGNGSISPPSQSVDHGDSTSLTITPDTGWHVDSVSGCGGSLSGSTYSTGSITGDCTVTATFQINTYTVTFVDYDATVLDTRSVDHGSAAIAPADPTRTGYTFTGWDVPFDNVTGDLTVIAQYEINTYTVTFVDHDATVLDTQTVDHGSPATAPADPTRTGYTFTGWDVPFDNVTGDLTVTAQYQINTYTLTYTAAPNGSISGASPQTVDHGSDGTAVEAVPDAGHHFVQWSDGSTDNPRTDSGVTADITVAAEFAINTYALTYTAGPNGSISGTSPQTVDHGSDGTAVEAVPDANHHFVQWSDGSTDNPRTDASVTADITVAAEFAIDTYTVTFLDHDGSVLKTEAVGHGAAATAPPDPVRAGYDFTGWDAAFDSVTSDLEVTAQYVLVEPSIFSDRFEDASP